MTETKPKDFDEILEEKNNEIEKLKKDYQEFKEQSAELETFLESESSEKDKEINSLSKKLEHIEKNSENLNTKHENSKKEIATLNKSIENIKKDLEKSQKDQQDFKTKIIELEQNNDELINKLRLSQSELDDIQEKYIQIQEEFVILKEDRDDLEKTKNDEITLLKEEIKEINEEFKTKLRNSEEKNAAASSAEKNTAESSAASTKYERKESMYNYVDLRSKYISEIDQLKDDIISLQTEYKVWQTKLNNADFKENKHLAVETNNIVEKTVLIKEIEKEKRSRISSFFSKQALEKMVQDIQSSHLIRKKGNLFSEKAIEDYKKTNDALIQENKKLTEVVEKVKSETIRNKEFIIKNIRELEKNHQIKIEKLTFENDSKYQELQKKYNELEKNFQNLQKITTSLNHSPISSSYNSRENMKFNKIGNLKSEDELLVNKRILKFDKFQLFLSIKNGKSTKSSCPYIDIKNENTIMIARITQNGLDKNQINKNLVNGTLLYFDGIFASFKKLEEKILDLTPLNKKNRAFILYGPKKSNKKNIQIYILETLMNNIKNYLKNIDCLKCDENEAYTLTLKYDSYTSDKKRKIKPYTLNLDYKLCQHDNVLKQFDLIFEELKKNFLSKTSEKDESSTMVRVFQIFLTNNINNENDISFLVISSNKIKSNLKKLETLSANIEEILKVNPNDPEKNFNTNNLLIYEKFLFVCVSPNLDNFKNTYETLNLANSIQKSSDNRSKSKNLEANRNHENENSQDSLLKLKNMSTDYQIMKEKISKKNKQIIDLKKLGKAMENEKNSLYKKLIVAENNNENMKSSFRKLLLNIKKISNESIHKQSRRKLMKVPTNTKLDRQTNIIQKLIDQNEYINFLKITQNQDTKKSSPTEKPDLNQYFSERNKNSEIENENEKYFESEKNVTDIQQNMIIKKEYNSMNEINEMNKGKLVIETKNFENCIVAENKVESFEDDDVL